MYSTFLTLERKLNFHIRFTNIKLRKKFSSRCETVFSIPRGAKNTQNSGAAAAKMLVTATLLQTRAAIYIMKKKFETKS